MARHVVARRQALPQDAPGCTRLLERRPEVLGPPPLLDLGERSFALRGIRMVRPAPAGR